MNIDTQMLYQMLDQIHDQIRNQMSQILTYFAVLSILQVVMMSVLIYLFIKGSREHRQNLKMMLKQNMNLGEEVQKRYNELQTIDSKLNNLLEGTNQNFPQNIGYTPKSSTIQFTNINNLNSENSEICNDPKLKELIKAYNQEKGSNIFISLTTVIDNLIKNGIVNSEEEAKKMINTLTKMYPSAIIIENVRGQKFPQIAILN